jgi:nucleotide-binding universal stress UspA family protein
MDKPPSETYQLVQAPLYHAPRTVVNMPKLKDRHSDLAHLTAGPTRARPVVLGTLSVRVDPSAERMAIDSALEAGVPLVLVNILRLRPYPTTLLLLGPEAMTLPHEEDLDAVRATAARAAELGVKTELLRVTTRHPVRALLEIVQERDAGLLVFGPDLKRTGRLRFRALARQVRRQAECLVWVAPDG